MIRFCLTLSILFLFNPLSAESGNDLNSRMTAELLNKFPNAEIQYLSPPEWLEGNQVLEVLNMSLLSENGQGEAVFMVTGIPADEKKTSSWGKVKIRFAAWRGLPIAKTRIAPNEILRPEWFEIQKTNLASGPARQFNGLILHPDVDYAELETIRTILPGGFPLLNSVRRVPDVRKGDLLRVHVRSGGIWVTIPGVAQEHGYLGNTVKVMTDKSKRFFTGKLVSKDQIEVAI